jgi:hypothetical protein
MERAGDVARRACSSAGAQRASADRQAGQQSERRARRPLALAETSRLMDILRPSCLVNIASFCRRYEISHANRRCRWCKHMMAQACNRMSCPAMAWEVDG